MERRGQVFNFEQTEQLLGLLEIKDLTPSSRE